MHSQRRLASDYKRLDSTSYDDVAAEFDRLTERYNGPLARRMLDLAGLRPSDHALDVGTGTGLVALRAATLARGGRVIGIDHSAGMLEEASRKAGRSELGDTVMFQRMDAERLEFPDRSFDVVLSLYALYHFPDPLAAIREMHRVLRPGGRVVIGVGASPSLLSWNGIVQGIQAASERVAMARGRLLTAPQFLLSLMHEHGITPEEDHQPEFSLSEIAHMLRQAGFERVYRRWQGHREELSPEDFWHVQATYTTVARIRLQQASSAQLTALKTDFLERCRGVQTKNGKLIYRHAAMFYAGTRA
jgi:ubiquinone/menaquinone biosynthesis C-methylase UbiE